MYKVTLIVNKVHEVYWLVGVNLSECPMSIINLSFKLTSRTFILVAITLQINSNDTKRSEAYHI